MASSKNKSGKERTKWPLKTKSFDEFNTAATE